MMLTWKRAGVLAGIGCSVLASAVPLMLRDDLHAWAAAPVAVGLCLLAPLAERIWEWLS